MMRGEVAGEVGSVDAFEQFVQNGNGFLGLALSGKPESLPGIPRVEKYLKDERDRKLLALLQSLSELGRLTAGPPGIPANILGVERQAMAAVMKDRDSSPRRRAPPADDSCPAKRRGKDQAALTQPPGDPPLSERAAGAVNYITSPGSDPSAIGLRRIRIHPVGETFLRQGGREFDADIGVSI